MSSKPVLNRGIFECHRLDCREPALIASLESNGDGLLCFGWGQRQL
jgi:hypothetical protein